MNAAQQPTLMRIPMRTLSRQTRYALEGVDDILVYKVAMTTRFRGVTRREGLLLHGHAGWGEAAPFWNYDDLESSRWLAAALESARRFPPVPRRKFVPVNVTIPVISPEEAYERVKASGGCATAKIKVAEPGVSVGRDCARIAAVADALRETVGGQAMIRLDANGAWEVDEAREAIPAMAAAAGVVPIEYVEQPCLTVDELAQVRRSVDVPIAADESIRRAEDPLEVARKEAADVVIIKVAPLGGVRAALKVARKSGLGVVVSSALETSVGLSVGVAAAAAVPGVPRAAGLATSSLLVGDVTQPLIPERGRLPVGRLEPDQELIDRTPVDGDLVSRWGMRLEGMAEHLRVGSRQAGRMPSVDTASAILSSLDALGVTHVLYCPGSRSAPFAYALEAGSFGGDARPILDERGAGFAAVGLARTGALPAIVVTSGTAVAELAPAVLEASHARLPLLVLSADRPGELRGVGASQATDQAGFFGTHVRASIDLEPQEASPSLVGHLARAVAAACGAPSGTPGPVQINVAFRDPLTPVRPTSDSGDEAVAPFVPRPTRVVAAFPVPARWEDVVGRADAGLIVAGEGASPRAREWSEASGFPLLAEPASGAWSGGGVTPFEQSLVSSLRGREVDAVVVTGRPTLSRPIQALLARPDVRVVVVDPHTPWVDISGNASVVVADPRADPRRSSRVVLSRARSRPRCGRAHRIHARLRLRAHDARPRSKGRRLDEWAPRAGSVQPRASLRPRCPHAGGAHRPLQPGTGWHRRHHRDRRRHLPGLRIRGRGLGPRGDARHRHHGRPHGMSRRLLPRPGGERGRSPRHHRRG